MKTTLRLAVAGLVALLLVSCSGSVTVGGGKTPADPIKTWPVAEPLEGEIPVGRWRCYPDQDLAAKRESNSSTVGSHCGIIGNHVFYEFRPDGAGWTLLWYDPTNSSIPSEAFKITGSNLVYSRDDEYRWGMNQGRLVVQTTRNRVGALTRVNDATFRYEPFGSNVLFRIGSSAHRRMVEFEQCVSENNGRNLFEVEDCGEPPDTGRG